MTLGFIGLVMWDFETLDHHYSSYSEITGGWFPFESKSFPDPISIHLRNNLDTNEYLFKIIFKEDQLNTLQNVLENLSQKHQVVDCAFEFEQACDLSSEKTDQVIIYETTKHIINGTQKVYMILDKQSRTLYMSDRCPVRSHILIEN